jgi:thiol-disulfide isomerase/thioredoxin
VTVPAPRGGGTLRRALAGAGAAACLLTLAACGGHNLSSGNQGFVSSDQTVTILAQADRKPPEGTVGGRTLDGKQVSLADQRGHVVVVPVWGSWCGPCRAEAPTLAAAARHFAGRGVVFLGIDSRDQSRSLPRAFTQHFDIPYPSIYDPGGKNLLAFHGTLSPEAIPSIVVVDKQGRVAARMIGAVDRSTLYGVVQDVLSGKVSS